MNKLMKAATKTSLSYGALATRAQRMLTTLSRTMTEVVFSLIGDQQGEAVSNLNRKQSGWKQVQQTGTIMTCPCTAVITRSTRTYRSLCNH